MKLSHTYYVFILVIVYNSSGQIIGILKSVKVHFPPNLEILPGSQSEWNSHAYYVFTLVVVYSF